MFKFPSLHLALAAVLSLLVNGLPAQARDYKQLASICDAAVPAPAAERIAACSQLIDSNTLAPKDQALAHLHRSWPLSQTGQKPRALEDLNAAASLDPLSAYVLSDRGFLHLRMGKTGLAIRDYSAALKLNPRTVYALYGRGIAYSRLGRKAEGLADLEAARGMQANVDNVFAALGVKP